MSDECFVEHHDECDQADCDCGCHHDQIFRPLSGWQPISDDGDDTYHRDRDWREDAL